MIAFACKRCGRQHSRPEGQAGTLIFCECGQSNRVPWESLAEAQAAEPVVISVPPLPAHAAEPILEAEPAPLPSIPLSGPNPRRGRLVGKINPRCCFQHPDHPVEGTCAVCRLPFCAHCLIDLRGQPVCGPCKNFQLAQLGRPRRVLPLAVIALVIALCAGPVAGILSLAGAGLYHSEGILGAALALSILALALPGTAFILAVAALRRLDQQEEVSGRGLAASGASAALVSIIWCITVAALLVGKHALG